MAKFNASKSAKACIKWIQDWFIHNSGNAEGIIIGISGGKDSTLVAKLCVEAIGKDRVFGVLMPHNTNYTHEDAFITGKKVCEMLGIKHRKVNLSVAIHSLESEINYGDAGKFTLSPKTKTNVPPRFRMIVLYAMGQEMGYRVAGTSNLSESTIGWCTKWGDVACDFNPIAMFTKTEVVEMGKYLGIPLDMIDKPPRDDLSGKDDEDNFGFTYKELDEYIRPNKEPTESYLASKIGEEKLSTIRRMEVLASHKKVKVPVFIP